jgi:hypothetical protein
MKFTRHIRNSNHGSKPACTPCTDRLWRRRALRLSCGGVFLAGLTMGAALLSGYNTTQGVVGGAVVRSVWGTSRLTWQLNPSVGSNVDTSSGVSVAAALANAFSLWQQGVVNGHAVPGMTNVTFSQGANTSVANPNANDCVNAVSFVPSAVSFGTGTVALTFTGTIAGAPPQNYQCNGLPPMLQTVAPYQIVDADIVFNPSISFTTASPAPPGKFSLTALAAHEIGHFIGLDHSGIGHAVMYPYGDNSITDQASSLAWDDLAGAGYLYPGASFAGSTGAISGRITLAGASLFGAHVVVIEPQSGAAVADTLTAPDGSYRVVGIPPGNYKVLALPLAGTFSGANFSGWKAGYPGASIPVNFSGKFH